MLTVIVILLFLPAMFFEYVTVFKQAETKVKIIHVSIMLISFFVLILYSLRISVPSPADLIISIIDAVFKPKG